MLEVRDLHKRYGAFHAVRGISFDVTAGEVVGFLGPNGAGKTTTMKIITGYLMMDSGTARVDGLDVVQDSLAVRRGIGYLPEHAPLYEDLTVTEALKFVADIRGMRGARRRERLEYVLGVCDLMPKRRAVIKTLSKGYRQRVGLAQAIIHEPKLVILDEPTVGLDPNQIVEIRELIRSIGAKNTVLFSSHILGEVEATCTRVMIVNDGQIVANDAPEALERAHAAKNRAQLHLRAPADQAGAAIARLDGVSDCRERQAAAGLAAFDLDVGSPEAVEASLGKLCAERGWTIHELAYRKASLEDVFRKLTKREKAPDAPSAAIGGLN